MEFSRRDFVKFLPTLIALGFMPKALLAAAAPGATPGHSGYNFKYIYGNEKLRERLWQERRAQRAAAPGPRRARCARRSAAGRRERATQAPPAPQSGVQ